MNANINIILYITIQILPQFKNKAIIYKGEWKILNTKASTKKRKKENEKE